MRAAQTEIVARVGVARVFYTDPGVRADEQHREQKTGLLYAAGDQNFVALDPDASCGQQAAVDLVDQSAIVAVNVVGRPAPDRLRLQCLHRTGAPVSKREQRTIELTVNKRIGLALPIGRLDDVALGRWLDLQPCAPVCCGACQGLMVGRCGDAGSG